MGKFQPGNPGGPGRPPKPVEDATRSVLLELFNEAAERAIVNAQIKIAKAGDTTAATWLWDRKYGRIKDHIDHEMIVRVIRNGGSGYSASDAAPAPECDTD